MISLKRTLDRLEELEAKAEAALAAYLEAISSTAEHAVEVEPQAAAPLKSDLYKLRQLARDLPEPQTLRTTTHELDRRLRDYAALSKRLLEARQKEIQSILAMVAEVAAAIGRRADYHASNFRAVARQLESVARLDNLTLIRERLAEAVSRLNTCTDQMLQHNHRAAAEMEEKLRGYQQRLQQAELLAMTDPLTGLANRRRAENIIESRIEAGAPLCLMLFDLDHFKTVNDRYGHIVGDHVLRAFAARLQSAFHPEDVVCRWGGDEFLVIIDGLLPHPEERAQQVANNLRGLYAIQGPTGPLNVEVSASVGVAQHQTGEDLDHLFARADASLFANKRRRIRGPLPPRALQFDPA